MDASFISTLNTLFWVCLSFTILFFILSVVLFFVFDIKGIFFIKTGRAQAKTVKEMEAANENTGRLRVGKKTMTSQLKKENKGVRKAVVTPPSQEFIRQNYNAAPPAAAPAPAPVEQGTEVLNDNVAETEVLGGNVAETEVLNAGAAQTSVLGVNNTQAQSAHVQQSAPAVAQPYFPDAQSVEPAQTSVLGVNPNNFGASYAETSVLSNQNFDGGMAKTEFLENEPVVGFKVIKNVMIIHTDELV